MPGALPVEQRLDAADRAALQERLERRERSEESPEERNARVHHLAALVKSGGYAVHSGRLATALLEWDPRRSNPKQSAEVADRRRAYMREYMRRRRALSGAGEDAIAAAAT